MHPYDQMLANEWEQRCAEEEAMPHRPCPEGQVLIYGDDDAPASAFCLDEDADDQDRDDEKAQERRWRVE